MVLLRCDQQQYPVPHLDSTQRGDTHVEEDAEQGRHRNHLQYRFHENRNSWREHTERERMRIQGNRLFILIVRCTCLWRAVLTDQDGHENATNPLLKHLLNLRFRALGHDSQSVGVGDGAHGGSAQPRHPENRADASHGDQDEQIKVETRSFHHLPLRFAHNQADSRQIWLTETKNSIS